MKDKYYLGIDIGSISTKGVIIDKDNNIVESVYLWTEGNPLEASFKVIKKLTKNNYNIVGVGTTGSARKLIGTMLNANCIKNEITAHAIGTSSKIDAKTIIEIGGQDSKIILLKDGIVTDYAMNTLCAAGTGAFLSSQAKRLGVNVKDFGKIALKSKKPALLAARCTVFAESDLVHKAQIGYKKEDIIAGCCNSVAKNYLNNVAKGKIIEEPIVFQGGVSKNIGVKHAFEKILEKEVHVLEDGHLMGALGIAILSKKQQEKEYNFKNIKKEQFITSSINCKGCPNNCEIVIVKKNGKLIDSFGNRCEKGKVKN